MFLQPTWQLWSPAGTSRAQKTTSLRERRFDKRSHLICSEVAAGVALDDKGYSGWTH